MAGETYVVKTGEDNYFWDDCLKTGCVALVFDKPYYDAWLNNDRETYFDILRSNAKKGTPEPAIRREATTWFNNGLRIRDSVDDVFIIRIGNNLFWAMTTDSEWYPVEHEHSGVKVVAICKPVDNWSRYDGREKPLQWPTIHNRAKDFLSPYPALFRVGDAEMREYLDALLHGDDLTPWHSQTGWKIKQGEDKGKSLATSATITETAVTDLWHSIQHTIKYENGQLILKKLKDKKLVGCTEAQMKAHLGELLLQQEGRCKLTGIQMHLPGQDGMKLDLKVSPDRIDSDGHYQIGNIQLVCRFINYWKCTNENGKFLELLDLVVAAKTGA